MPQSATQSEEAKAMEVDESEVIEIDETFAPSATTPPGTDGRDQNNQAPASATGIEFVALQGPIPAEGDTEVIPPALTEEDEILASNDEPIDDVNQILEMLQGHIVAAELQGHEPDEEILFNQPILTHLPDSMSKCRGCSINFVSPLRSLTLSASTRTKRQFPDLRARRSRSAEFHEEGTKSKADVGHLPKGQCRTQPMQEPKPKASKKSPDEAASSSNPRPAGAEADAESKTAQKLQLEKSARPAGAEAEPSDRASAKTAVKSKAMPKTAPKAPPMPKGATSPFSIWPI